MNTKSGNSSHEPDLPRPQDEHSRTLVRGTAQKGDGSVETTAARSTQVTNWFGSITSSPQVVVEVGSVEEIVSILKDHDRYPTPVRAVGSNHSTTPCGVAEGGTLIVTRDMDRILMIGND